MTQLPRVIGFCGLTRHGKDTAGEAFRRRGYIRSIQSGGLKAMLTALLEYQGIKDYDTLKDLIEGQAREREHNAFGGKTGRYAQQGLGTEWGRDWMGTDFWTHININRIETNGWQGVYIPDIRFSNEIDLLAGVFPNFACYRVVDPRKPIPDREKLHISEQGVFELDVQGELYNDFDTAEEFTVHVGALIDGGFFNVAQ